MPGVTAGAPAQPGMKAQSGPKSRPGIKARLVGAAYALGWSAICRLPESWAAAVFRFVADIAWRRQGPGIRVLEGNLLRVLGPATTGQELRAASRASMRSYAGTGWRSSGCRSCPPSGWSAG